MDTWPSVEDLAAEIKAGERSAVELVRQCLQRIKATEQYHALLEINEQAEEQAQEIDDTIAKGEDPGVLAGVPFIAKDNFATLETKTTAASKMLADYTSPYAATAVMRLQSAGAILLGKANLDEFAHGGSTENSAFGPTLNPHNPEYVPGGSSGGSAASVALGQCAFALGTDTGGSNRLPGAYCGVAGYKPTYGLVSRYGVIAMASSTDCPGPIARTPADVATVLDVLAGQDEHDATTIDRHESYRVDDQPSLKGKKIGIIKEFQGEGVERYVQDSLNALIEKAKDQGAEVSEVSVPHADNALAVYYVIVPAEISSNLSRFDGIRYGYQTPEASSLAEVYQKSRAEGFGPEVKRRIMLGTYVLSSGYYDAYYRQAQLVRSLLIEEYEEAFRDVDILVGATATGTAFKLNDRAQDPMAMYLTDKMTVLSNLVGTPAISIPLGQHDGLPFGMQVMAGFHEDQELLSAAQALQQLSQT